MKYLILNKNVFNIERLKTFLNRINLDKRALLINRSEKTIISSIMLSMLIKDEYNTDYNKMTILFNKNGKPYFKDSNIYFSISHSYEYIIVAISNKPIGIDIEKIRRVNLNVLNHFCNGKEKAIIHNSENTYIKLFQIFTAKEAYIKMKGLTLKEIQAFNIFKVKDCNFKNIIINKKYVITICEKKAD